MTLPKELTTVTPFSKAFALVLFIILPFYGFYLGTLYQQTINGIVQLQSQPAITTVLRPTPTPLLIAQPAITTDPRTGWKIYQSSMNSSNEIAITEDWFDFSFEQGDIPFSFQFPDDWNVNYGVFDDTHGKKIAELLPGAVKLKQGQHCFDTPYDSNKSQGQLRLISRENIIVNNQKGVKEVEAYYDIHYPITYCLEKDNQAFIITFYEDKLNSDLRSTFDKVMSTFKFLQ